MKAKGKRSNSVSDPLSTVLEPLKAAVIHPWHPQPKGVDLLRPIEAALEEAVNLTAAINLDVVYFETVRLNHPTPATLLGAGAVERLKAQFSELGVSLAVINHPLSPVQQRNLERDWQIKVIDRTGLILEIFGDRARTAEGKLQVELAALDFQRSRLEIGRAHV